MQLASENDTRQVLSDSEAVKYQSPPSV